MEKLLFIKIDEHNTIRSLADRLVACKVDSLDGDMITSMCQSDVDQLIQEKKTPMFWIMLHGNRKEMSIKAMTGVSDIVDAEPFVEIPAENIENIISQMKQEMKVANNELFVIIVLIHQHPINDLKKFLTSYSFLPKETSEIVESILNGDYEAYGNYKGMSDSLKAKLVLSKVFFDSLIITLNRKTGEIALDVTNNNWFSGGFDDSGNTIEELKLAFDKMQRLIP